jgi:hypothetical protein
MMLVRRYVGVDTETESPQVASARQRQVKTGVMVGPRQTKMNKDRDDRSVWWVRRLNVTTN